MSAAVPIGAKRMIHHRTVWMTLRKDSVNRRNGSAARPALTAATPMAREMTKICRTLKVRPTVSSSGSNLPVRPMMLAGTMDCKKPIQEPVWVGAAAVEGSMLVPAPGRSTSAATMPASTEKNAVMANHTSVEIASRAALVTLRRLATEVTTAVKTSGGIMTLRS